MLVAILSWPVLYGLFRLRARGREHLPEGGYVLAANHNSNLDPWPLGMPLFREVDERAVYDPPAREA